MRISQKELFETWDLYHKKLRVKYGNIDLWVPGAGLSRTIYNKDTQEDLVRGTNGKLWSWIIQNGGDKK